MSVLGCVASFRIDSDAQDVVDRGRKYNRMDEYELRRLGKVSVLIRPVSSRLIACLRWWWGGGAGGPTEAPGLSGVVGLEYSKCVVVVGLSNRFFTYVYTHLCNKYYY